MRAHKHEEETREVLDAIGAVLDDYVVFPSQEARDTAVIWTLHQWVYKKFPNTPRLSFFSNEPGSGKTRVMELVAGMGPKVLSGVSIRPSMIYNAIEEMDSVTIAFDEVDTVFSRRGNNGASKQLQGILNDGFRTKGTTLSGSPGNYREVPTSCPVVMAGLGRLPDATQSRCIRIGMKRATDDVELKEYRERRVEVQFYRVQKLCNKWARSKAAANLKFLDPEMPVSNRDADKWEPLFTIAEQAGGDWPKRITRACRLLEGSGSAKASEGVPSEVRMLRDVEDILARKGLMEGDDKRVQSEDLVSGLVEEGWDPRYANAKALASVLDEYGVEPSVIRFGNKTARGYYVDEIKFALGMI